MSDYSIRLSIKIKACKWNLEGEAEWSLNPHSKYLLTSQTTKVTNCFICKLSVKNEISRNIFNLLSSKINKATNIKLQLKSWVNMN